jgi:hypothetical protein
MACLRMKFTYLIIFHVVWYGCETWSVTLRDKHMLRAFDNGVLRKIFGHKRQNIAACWGKLHNKEL